MLIMEGDLQQARQKFEQALQGEDKDLVTMLVLGDGPLVEKIAALVETRAQALPNGRRGIWIKLPGLLTEDEKIAYGFTDPDVVVSVLNPEGDAVCQLRRQDAQSLTKLERAFIQGQKN